MNMTRRKPVGVGEMLAEEFLAPYGLTQKQLAEMMGVSRRTVNEICTGHRSVTADTALMLAKVFGNTPEFWLNVQRRNDLWVVLNTPERNARVERARPMAA